ncbi:MAG: DUF6612 family protein [Ignavibacteriales bacterium]
MKSFKIGSLLLGVILLVSGCSLSAGERIMKASEKTDEVDSCRTNIKMDIEMDVEGETFVTKVDSNGEFDNKNGTAYMYTKMNMLDITAFLDMYISMNDDIETYYTKVNGAGDWLKESEPVEELDDQNDAVSEIIDTVTDNVKLEEKETENGITHYVITLDKESTKEILLAFNELLDSEVVDDNYKITGDLAIDIYINEDNYITSLVMDLSNAITYTDPETNIEVKVNKFKMQLDFYDFNNVGTITIPQHIIDSAVEIEE